MLDERGGANEPFLWDKVLGIFGSAAGEPSRVLFTTVFFLRYNGIFRRGLGHMPQYRAYRMRGDHAVGPPYELICDNDDDAIARARRFVLDWDIEIWQLDRLVIRLRRRTST